MFRSKIWLSLVLCLLMSASKPALGAPGDRLRARVQECQQRVDKADARCRDLVRDIANARSAEAVPELNRQLKSWEKERSDAQFAFYQARDQLGSLERQAAQLKADIDAFLQARRQLETDAQSFVGEMDAHNRDAAACNQAVANYNSLPLAQRTQAEHDRLSRWGNEVNARKGRLEARRNELAGRLSELQRRANSLKARAQQLEGS